MKKVSVTFLLILSMFVLISCRDSKIKVGILQYVSHQDLDDATDGFIQALKEDGFIDGDNIKITILNPQTDMSTMQTQAATLVRKSDLLLAVATPAAVALANELEKMGKDTPLLFTAVTDPVAVNLVESLTKPSKNITGTSDMNPIDKQISLVKRIKPHAERVGILYTSSESNSKIQAEIAKMEVEKLGLEAVIKTLSNATDIPTVFSSLVREVDVIYIPSDNLISSNMGAIETSLIANSNRQVPIIAATTFQVEEGASLTYGFSYLKIGIQTGKMAVKILNGAKPGDLDVEFISDTDLIINLRQLTQVLNLNVPKDLIAEATTILE